MGVTVSEVRGGAPADTHGASAEARRSRAVRFKSTRHGPLGAREHYTSRCYRSPLGRGTALQCGGPILCCDSAEETQSSSASEWDTQFEFHVSKLEEKTPGQGGYAASEFNGTFYSGDGKAFAPLKLSEAIAIA